MSADIKRVLVTGAGGYVGNAVAKELAHRHDLDPLAAVRFAPTDSCSLHIRHVAVGNIDASTKWGEALAGVEAVIHTAARVHVMHETAVNPLAEFQSVNVAGTLNLARQAAAAGVKRLVFVSSVKVNGEFSTLGQPFKPEDAAAPADPYGQSKHEAELGLRVIAAETGLEVVIVRSPLVYGPGVKANFAAMVRWVSRGLPIPLGSVVHNRRSLVALPNLVSFLLLCAVHPAAANQTFLVSDDEDVSTAELLRRIGKALGKPVRLMSVPVASLHLLSTVTGQASVAQRLLGNLQVDMSKNRLLLGWRPPVSMEEGLKQAVAGFV